MLRSLRRSLARYLVGANAGDTRSRRPPLSKAKTIEVQCGNMYAHPEALATHVSRKRTQMLQVSSGPEVSLGQFLSSSWLKAITRHTKSDRSRRLPPIEYCLAYYVSAGGAEETGGRWHVWLSWRLSIGFRRPLSPRDSLQVKCALGTVPERGASFESQRKDRLFLLDMLACTNFPKPFNIFRSWTVLATSEKESYSFSEGSIGGHK